MTLDQLNRWVGELLWEKEIDGMDIFRMKGILWLAGEKRRYILQAVHELFDCEPMREDTAAHRASNAENDKCDGSRPVIFLDIDGVLNRTRTSAQICMDEDLIGRLRQLVETTNAVIVLSTFWRPFETYIKYVLHRHHISADIVIGCTPGKSNAATLLLSNNPADAQQYAGRASEIHAWLSEHPNVQQYCIIDDRSAASDDTLAAHFVQTDSNEGLTEDDVERCRLVLMSTVRLSRIVVIGRDLNEGRIKESMVRWQNKK